MVTDNREPRSHMGFGGFVRTGHVLFLAFSAATYYDGLMARLARIVAPGVPDHIDPAWEAAGGDVLERGGLYGVSGVHGGPVAWA